MAKAEISWRRDTEDGERVQVYAQHVGREWIFYLREKRFDQWQHVEQPLLEDWLALLDAVRRRVPRKKLQPADEAHLVRRIRERFPEVELD